MLKIKLGDGGKQALFIAFFAMSLSMMIGCSYWVFRFGLAFNSFYDVIKVISIAVVLLIAPTVANLLLANKRSSLFIGTPLLTLFCLILLPLLGLLAKYLNLFIIIAIISIIVLAIFVVLIYKFRPPSYYWVVVPLFFFWAVGAVWGFGYLSPIFFEKLAVGHGHTDTLFHLDIANMIKNYGIPSQGIDGLAYYTYHWGSHYLFSQLSRLINVDLITFYNLGYPAIFIPLFVKLFMDGVLLVREKLGKESEIPAWSWLILFIALVGVLPVGTAMAMGLQWNTLIQGESQLVSYILAILLFSVGVSLIGVKKNRIDTNLFLFAVAPLMFVLIAIAKIPMLVIALPAYVYLQIRLGLYRRLNFLISGILILAVSILTYKIVSVSAGVGFEFMSFFKTQLGSDLKAYFAIYFFFWAWLVVILFLYQSKIKTIGSLVAAIKSKKTIFIEIVILISVVGVIPALFFQMPGGGVLYFLEQQKWLSIMLILGLFVGRGQTVKNWREISAAKVIFALLLIPLILVVFNNLKTFFYGGLIVNEIATRNYIVQRNREWGGVFAEIGSERANGKGLAAAITSTLSQTQDSLNSDKSYLYFKFLRELNAEVEPSTAIFIPQEDSLFWDRVQITSQPIVAQAVSGYASVLTSRPYVPQEIVQGKFKFYILDNLSKEEKLFVLSCYEKNEKPSADGSVDLFYTLKSNISPEDESKLFNVVSSATYKSIRHYSGFKNAQFISQAEYEKRSDDRGICNLATEHGFERVIVVFRSDEGPKSRIIICSN